MRFAVLSLSLVLGFAVALPSAGDPAKEINGTDIERKIGTSKSRGQPSCCSILRDALPGKVNRKGREIVSFIKSGLSYYSAQERLLIPDCYVRPTSAHDVATAVKILAEGDRAKTPGCTFAVKSGGHTPNEGAANIDGGVTLDLVNLNQVTISADKTSVSIGPGNRWGDVYQPLDVAGIAIVGGRDSGVGVGGLVTGGGISYFSGRRGFSVDNVRNYQIVLANGTIAESNANSNPDLYKALKGGSSNLGIVTRFDFEAFQQGLLWGGYSFNDISIRAQSFPIFENFGKSVNFDPFSAWIHSFSYSVGIWLCANSIIYTKPSAGVPEVFKPYDALPKSPIPPPTYRNATLTNFAEELSGLGGTREGLRVQYSTFTFKNSGAFMGTLFDGFERMVKSLAIRDPSTLASLSFQPLPSVITSKGPATGGNILGVEGGGDLIVAFIDMAWLSPLSDKLFEDAIKALLAETKTKAEAAGVADDYLYLNYAGAFQKPIAGYGQENVDFLTRVAGSVDPTGLFQRQLPGGFKLDD